MKHVILFILIFIYPSVNLFSQDYSQDYAGHNAIFSLKTGYHSPTIHEAASGGVVFDFTGELHLGKRWYFGMNFDYWFAGKRDKFDNSWGEYFYNYGTSPLIKYKFFFKQLQFKNRY